ncbi:MAG: hypothetical protein ABSG68_06355 [Thermoguttaceae bacterium]|jgi:hypothetical protein
MEAWQLSVELQELERALAGRPLPGPSAHLRQKVLGAAGDWSIFRPTGEICTNDEIRKHGPVPFPPPCERLLPPDRGQARWRFAVAAAAAALVWLNLSLAATRATDCGLRRHGPGQSIETACRQIEQLLPEFSPEQSRRQAILLRAGSALVPCPDLSSSGEVANLARSFLLDERREERSN